MVPLTDRSLFKLVAPLTVNSPFKNVLLVTLKSFSISRSLFKVTAGTNVIPDESSVSIALPFKVKLPNCIDEALVAITALLAAPNAFTVIAAVFNKLNVV